MNGNHRLDERDSYDLRQAIDKRRFVREQALLPQCQQIQRHTPVGARLAREEARKTPAINQT
jgi:hypothetical protein